MEEDSFKKFTDDPIYKAFMEKMSLPGAWADSEEEEDEEERKRQKEEEERIYESNLKDEIDDYVSLAYDDRYAGKEIYIPIGLEILNIANIEFFQRILQPGDKILMQRLKHSTPVTEVITFMGFPITHRNNFVYQTSSGKQYENDMENLVLGDENISDFIDRNSHAFKILRVFPGTADFDMDKLDESVDTFESLVPPFDVPIIANSDFFKKNLDVNQILVAKRYIPGKYGKLIKVQNNLLVKEVTNYGITWEYSFGDKKPFSKKILFSDIYGDETKMPIDQSSITVSRVLPPVSKQTTSEITQTLTDFVPDLTRMEILKRDIKVGSKLLVNRLKPGKTKDWIITKNNEVTVIQRNNIGIRVAYYFEDRLLWDAFIPFDRIFDSELALITSNTDKAIQLLGIKNHAGGKNSNKLNLVNNDIYYLKYLKYKSKYLKLKNI